MVRGNIRVYEENFENFVSYNNCGYVINSNALILTVKEDKVIKTIFYPFTNIKRVDVSPVEDDPDEAGSLN